MRYETAADIQNELNAVQRFAAVGGYSYKKMDKNALDFILYDSKGLARCFVEIKCFTTSSTQYQSQIISLLKWGKMMQYTRFAPVFFVCCYSDGVILYINADDIRGEVKEFSRRNQRPGNTNDTEFVISSKRDKMKKL